MAKQKLSLDTLADIYTQATSLVPGEAQGRLYRFESGTGHVSYDGSTLEYDGEKCKITVRNNTENADGRFRIDYEIYPSVVLDAVEKGRANGKDIKTILESLVPATPLRGKILLAGFNPTEDDAAGCTVYANESKSVYKLIEHYIKKDPMYTGDKKTFISERKQQAKHERGKRSIASRAQHTRDYNGSQPQHAAEDTSGSNPESPRIPV